MRVTATLALAASVVALVSTCVADPPSDRQATPGIAPTEPSSKSAQEDQSAPAAAPENGGDPFVDATVTFVPKTPDVESAVDRREARAMYATAISLKGRGQLAEALRLFQRAHRADPAAIAPLMESYELCHELERGSETYRYLARAIGAGTAVNPQLALEAADWFVKHGEPAAAAAMYDYARRSIPSNKNSAYLLLSIEAGRMYFAAGNLKAAAEPFTHVLDALEKPDEYELDRRLRNELEGDLGLRLCDPLAEAFLSAGLPDLAERAFAKRQTIVEEPPRQKIEAARIAQARGDHAKAVALLEEFFALNVDVNVEPYDLFRQSLQALNRNADLAPALEKLLTAKDAPLSLRGYVARLRREAKRFAEARPLWESLLSEEAWHAEAMGAMIETLAAERAIEPLLSMLGDAVAERQSLEGVGDSAAALTSDAELMDQLIAAALATTSPVAEGKFGPYLAAALLALDAKRFDDASKLFSLALERITEDRGTIVLRWGVGLIMADRIAAAAETFRQGIDAKLLPAGNPTFHYYLARALASDKQTEAALAVAAEAVAIAPDAPRVAGLKPWIFYHAKRYDEAVAQYQEFVDRFDGERGDDGLRDEIKVARLILSNIGVIQKDFPRAEELLEQVLDEFPDDPGALNDLGYLWADRNVRLARALDMLKRAVAAEPDNAAYRDSLGWVYHRLGRREEALAEIQKAVAGGSSDGVVLDHLGDVLAALDREPEARDAWSKALAALESQGDSAAAGLVRTKLDKPPGGK